MTLCSASPPVVVQEKGSAHSVGPDIEHDHIFIAVELGPGVHCISMKARGCLEKFVKMCFLSNVLKPVKTCFLSNVLKPVKVFLNLSKCFQTCKNGAEHAAGSGD